MNEEDIAEIMNFYRSNPYVRYQDVLQGHLILKDSDGDLISLNHDRMMQIPRDYIFTGADLPERLAELTREYIKHYGELGFRESSDRVH
jgi:hypothetical protein